jgi:hypothetical protein
MMGVAFTQDPGVEFVVDSPITVGDNQMVRDMVNTLLSRIARRIFLETWVMPHWRNFYLPLLQPYPSQVLERPTLNPCPSRPVQDSRLPASWDPNTVKTAPVQSSPKKSNTVSQGDCLQDIFFPYNIILTDDVIPEYRESFTRIFTDIIAQIHGQDNTDPLFKYKLTWRNVRKRQDITIEKTRVMLSNALLSELTKATFTVPFEAQMVYFVIQYFIFIHSSLQTLPISHTLTIHSRNSKSSNKSVQLSPSHL